MFLTAEVAGGGTMRYCLETFSGEPGPNSVVKDSGMMTFALPDGALQARVRITQTSKATGGTPSRRSRAR